MSLFSSFLRLSMYCKADFKHVGNGVAVVLVDFYCWVFYNNCCLEICLWEVCLSFSDETKNLSWKFHLSQFCSEKSKTFWLVALHSVVIWSLGRLKMSANIAIDWERQSSTNNKKKHFFRRFTRQKFSQNRKRNRSSSQSSRSIIL